MIIDEQVAKMNEYGCEYGKLTSHKLGVVEKCGDENRKSVSEMFARLDRLNIILIIVTFFSGASAMGYVLDVLKMIVGGR